MRREWQSEKSPGSFLAKVLSCSLSLINRDRTDTPVKEREEAKEGSLEKRFKHSEMREKKCPNCPISFVFQVHPCHSYITVSDKVCGIVDDIEKMEMEMG